MGRWSVWLGTLLLSPAAIYAAGDPCTPATAPPPQPQDLCRIVDLAFIRPGSIDWRFFYRDDVLADEGTVEAPGTRASTDTQFGLPDDDFHAGEPLSSWENGRDELVVFRREANAPAAFPGVGTWYLRRQYPSSAGYSSCESSGNCTARYWGLDSAVRTLVGRFRAPGDGSDSTTWSRAAIILETGQPGIYDLIINWDRQLDYTTNEDGIYPIEWHLKDLNPLAPCDRVMVGDRDGDGDSDIYVHRKATSSWEIYSYRFNGGVPSLQLQQTVPIFGEQNFGGSTACNSFSYLSFVADLTQDGRDDIAIFYYGVSQNRILVLPACSNGQYPTKSTQTDFVIQYTSADMGSIAWSTAVVPIHANAFADTDGDGKVNCSDTSCPTVFNPGSFSCTDCDENGVSDAYEINQNGALDCNGNGVLDECEPDCDNDGIPDGCEADCDGDGTPDDCQPFLPDSDGDGVNDCDDTCPEIFNPIDPQSSPPEQFSCTDCNDVGMVARYSDEWEIFEGISIDCDENEVPDDCDLADAANDCDADGELDECNEFYMGESIRIWTGPAFGEFDDELNWCAPGDGPGVSAPSALDVAIFARTTATVQTVESVAIDGLQIISADITLDLSQQFLDTLGTNSDSIDVSGALGTVLRLQSGSLTASGGLNIGSDGKSDALFTLLDDTAAFITGDVTLGADGGRGSVEVLGGSTLFAFGTTQVGDSTGSRGALVIDSTDPEASMYEFFTGLNVVNGDVRLDSNGVISSFSGLIPMVIRENGTLTGSGLLDTEVVNLGLIDPAPDDPVRGAAGATLTILGDVDQIGAVAELDNASGDIVLDIGGDPMTPVADQIIIDGTANLRGGLRVRFPDGFEPDQTALNGLPLITTAFPLSAGRFDVVFMPGLTPAPDGVGRYLRVEYDDLGERGTSSVTLIVETLTGDIDVDPASFTSPNGPSAAAVGDLGDGAGGPPDGFIDLAITVPDQASPSNPGQLVVLFNGGVDVNENWLGFSSSTSFATGADPSGVAIGDIDGDDEPDVVVSNRFSGTVTPYFNDGLSSLLAQPEVTVGSGASSPEAVALVALAELDHNGQLDVITANSGDNAVALLVNSDGSLGAPSLIPVGFDPNWIAVDDLDNDKWDDLTIANEGSNDVSVLFNDLSVPFATAIRLPVGAGPFRATSADLNLDGHADLIITNRDDASVSIIRNEGGRLFSPQVAIPVGVAPTSVAAADLDLDGDADISLIADDPDTGDRTVQVLRNDQSGAQITLAPAPDLAADRPSLLVTGDVDNLDVADLIVVGDPLLASTRSLGRGPQPDIGAVFLRPIETPACPADVDGSGTTDINDLNVVLSNWNMTPALPADGDVDGDGTVSFEDLNAVLEYWGCGVLTR